MSSFATATSRNPDKEPNGKQVHLLVDPEGAPQGESQPRAETAGNSHTLDDVARVERLLSQLEARSMALVPYGYGSLPEVRSRKLNTGLIAGVLVGLWLTTLVLVVAYMRYVGHSPFTQDRASSGAPLIIAPDTDPQQQKVAASVDNLAKALVTSSERLNQMQSALEKSNRDLQKTSGKVNSSRANAPAVAAKSADDSQGPAVPMGADPKVPKNWHRVLDVKPSENAVPHKNPNGEIDYWVVPRGVDASPTKVLSIGSSTDGVVVHNLEDGKDYTLTPTGEWRNGSLTGK